MKRSEINEIVTGADRFIRSFGFLLPPFADWSPERMRQEIAAGGQIPARGLGWDVTDYGLGRFDEIGLTLFTLRNGDADDLRHGRGMLYAEKIMISRRDQIAPMHRHKVKAEDIINRGGGTLVIELFAPDGTGGIDERAQVAVPQDGVVRTLPAGGCLKLAPGESVTLLPGIWHAFWAEGADTLVGEVSTVNDDRTDNVFRDRVARFSDVEEDVPPVRLLVSDY